MIGDLGCVEIADPHLRLQKKLRLGVDNLHVCTPNYKPPDVWLGNQQYGEELDMWSFGCVAAEVYSRKVLIAPAGTTKQAQSPIKFFEAIAAIVPNLHNWPPQTCPASWLEEKPFFKKWYGCSGQEWLKAQAATARTWPPRCLDGYPDGLAQLVQDCLAWHPSARMTAAEAKTSGFLQPPGQWPLCVRLHARLGKNGIGSIAHAFLEPDLLRYLQTCPSWNSLAQKRMHGKAAVARCVAAEEAALCLKTEIPGFVDEENPRSVAA